jgi:DNA-binding transcriptional MerR regulator
MAKTYSTLQVSKMLGVGSDTLHRWIREKKVLAPPVQFVGGIRFRLWTQADIDKARKYMVRHYWGKGSPRKRKSQKRRSE